MSTYRVYSAGLYVVSGNSDLRRVYSSGLYAASSSDHRRVYAAGAYVVTGEGARRLYSLGLYAVTDRPMPPGQPIITVAGTSLTTARVTVVLAGTKADDHSLYVAEGSSVNLFDAGNLVASGLGASPTTIDFGGIDPGETYWVGLRASNADGDTDSDPVSVATGLDASGAAPTVRIGAVTNVSVAASIDAETAVLSVRWRLFANDGSFIASAITTGSNRFTEVFSGLAISTQYSIDAQVERAAGWSLFGAAVSFTTLTTAAYDGQTEWDIGEGACRPTAQPWLWNPDANPITPETQRGLGFSTPLPGQPMRGTVACRLRWWTVGNTWAIDISDDAGATYTPLTTAPYNGQGADGDLLYCYDFLLDTSGLSDGMDYRLRATSDHDTPVVLESLTFPVDNAGAVAWWRNGEDLTDRFGPLWNTVGMQVPGVWYRGGRDGCFAALFNHEQALATDTQLPLCQGGDVTTRFYIWSGEGGLFTLQGRDDTELFGVGIGFFAEGTGYGNGGEQRGIFVGIEQWTTWPLGCADDYLTGRAMGVVVRNAHSIIYQGYMDGEGGAVDGNLGGKFTKMRFKTTSPPSLWTTDFPIMHWRDGATPGATHQSAKSCGRRWEVYSLRVRAELDPGDATRVRIRIRLDGPHVDPPDTGYWHVDDWFAMPTDAPTSGVLGMASYQPLQDAYGTPNGVRVFASWSALPFYPSTPNPVEPDTPPVWNPVQEGEPCTLILQVYDDDWETVAWEVGTDENHPQPYLAVPDNYGAQEIDLINGAATIGTIQVGVIDKAQTAGDQDSGWLTEQMMNLRVHGRRNRLIRFISPELGWVVIADGPAGTPRLHDSYAGYLWTIRDTRESERKLRAFTGGATPVSCFPRGTLTNWGTLPDGGGYLLEPVEPLTGTYHYALETGWVDLTAYLTPPDAYNPDAVADDRIIVTEALRVAGEATSWVYDRTVAGLDIYRFYYDRMLFQWRTVGSSDWNDLRPYRDSSLAGAANFWDAGTHPAKDADGNVVQAQSQLFVIADLGIGDGTAIELRMVYQGEVSEDYPLYLETTLGQLTKDLYDGVYSPDAEGNPLPTGIRYDEDRVLAMTEPVLARITEPVDDLRDWLEQNGYGPSQWNPALDRDLYVSPISDIPPDDMTGLIHFDKDNTHPTSSWNAGETIINILRYKYRRFYPGADTPDGIGVREVTLEFDDAESIAKYNEQRQEYDTLIFGAIGDENGDSAAGLTNEYGYIRAWERKEYIFDRYHNGAQTIEVPVKRADIPTMRPGDWGVVDLSWFPDYVMLRRGALWYGQVLAIHDLDCEWRTLLIEEALPMAAS